MSPTGPVSPTESMGPVSADEPTGPVSAAEPPDSVSRTVPSGLVSPSELLGQSHQPRCGPSHAELPGPISLA